MPVSQEASPNEEPKQGASAQAAAARTLARGLALYFSRPVRLFRPSKISGWQSLRSLAEHQGAAYDHKFVSSLVKIHGFDVFRKHFLPPLVVNAILGTVLWTAYGAAYSVIEPNLHNKPLTSAALSGGMAGGIQALVAAPVENVRFVIEGGAVGQSWLQSSNLAGRGWSGWGWGFAKDICAFSAFFTIFEATRRIGQATKVHSESFMSKFDESGTRFGSMKRHTPRVLNSFVLVTGGVFAGLAYEVVCRPWDRARRLIHLYKIEPTQSKVFQPLSDAIRAEGFMVFFRDTNSVAHDVNPGLRAKLMGAARVLGRVGPWGIGFLVWEMYGSGLS
ncbi:hypothetical protein Agabi119p4_3178 [Agaricus bisporus var. burnettii]|uniref:Mitochondrial carrier protein n=1 Tax=Agaricus bisporus var. burnettii TaxID=192524 RepID=A0A8H7F6S8_AGABI|nr:hypothetical protein Agabi119p4_3178 [Agaricus bisporus var. burnettii]